MIVSNEYCASCEAEFTVEHYDDDFTVEYCPLCGEKLTKELDLGEECFDNWIED